MYDWDWSSEGSSLLLRLRSSLRIFLASLRAALRCKQCNSMRVHSWCKTIKP
jgi:DTW domain-containing protein YfiP